MRTWMTLVEGMTELSFLYHCSPAENFESIKQNGFDPTNSKWSKAVYLAGDEDHAGAYDGHHGQEASVMFAVEIAKIDQSRLTPDDVDLPDCLGEPDDWDQFDWKESITICGQCCYKGVIPPAAIFYRKGDEWISVTA